MCRLRGGKEDPLPQVPLSAGWEAHEEDFCLQRQRLHAAVRSAGQEARVLVLCAAGKVSAALFISMRAARHQAASDCAEGHPLPNTSQWLAELQSTPPPVL